VVVASMAVASMAVEVASTAVVVDAAKPQALCCTSKTAALLGSRPSLPL
jgi:hypothetical protein